MAKKRKARKGVRDSVVRFIQSQPELLSESNTSIAEKYLDATGEVVSLTTAGRALNEARTSAPAMLAMKAKATYGSVSAKKRVLELQLENDKLRLQVSRLREALDHAILG